MGILLIDVFFCVFEIILKTHSIFIYNNGSLVARIHAVGWGL